MRTILPGHSGQTSSAHSVMTACALAGSMSSTDLLRWTVMSMPISRIAVTACGLIRLGWLPALCSRTSWPNRVRARPSAICDLAELATLDLNQSTASRHLGILKAAGIVDSRREGTWVYYAITDQEHATVAKALEVLTKAFGAERALRTDHAKLRKSCGPTACAS